MTSRDWKEVAGWAAVTAVVTVGALAGRVAVSDGAAAKPASPAATINGCLVTARAAGGSPGTVVVTVRVSNTTPRKASYAFPVDVVRQEFRGNPFSRVMSAGDFVRTTVSTQQMNGGIGPAGHKDVSFSIKAPPSAASLPQAMPRGLVLSSGTATITSANATPSANAIYVVNVHDGNHTVLTVFPARLFAGKS